MGYVIKIPKLGLEMEQGTLLEWHVGEGDSVEEGETIAEVESEKSLLNIEGASLTKALSILPHQR